MKAYETVFIVRPTVTQEDAEKIFEFYKDNITSHGGEIVKAETWGKLALAYEIDDEKEGYYYIIQYNAAEDYNEELEKRYRYNEDVLRYVVVQLDEKKFKANPKKDATPRRSRRPRPDSRGERPAPAEEPKAAEAAEEPKAETPAETTESAE